MSALEYARTKPVTNWPGLLRQIAIARALDQVRKRRRGPVMQAQELNELPSHEGDPLQKAEAEELSDHQRIALAELPPPQSRAFCLRYLSGLEYAEIAAEMEITVDAAGALLHRARARLGECLRIASSIDGKRR